MVLFIRVPYYLGDLKRDPNLDNYPYKSSKRHHKGSSCVFR